MKRGWETSGTAIKWHNQDANLDESIPHSLHLIQAYCPPNKNKCSPWCNSASVPCAPDSRDLDLAVDDCSDTSGAHSCLHHSSWCLLLALIDSTLCLKHLQGQSILIHCLFTAIFGQGSLGWAEWLYQGPLSCYMHRPPSDLELMLGSSCAPLLSSFGWGPSPLDMLHGRLRGSLCPRSVCHQTLEVSNCPLNNVHTSLCKHSLPFQLPCGPASLTGWLY